MKDGETLNVVLLDSEGMGRPGAEAEHDARVFSLATLLSSLLVYNWCVGRQLLPTALACPVGRSCVLHPVLTSPLASNQHGGDRQLVH